MKRALSASLGAGVALLVVGSPVAGTGDSPPPPSVADDSQPAVSDGFVIPAGYRVLVDDTIHLTVAIPDTWTDLTTAPDTIDDAVIPQINAATDLDVWRDTFDAPGVLYAAYPFTDDTETLYSERFEPAAGCTARQVVDYDDGAFVGRWWQNTGCGPAGQAERHVIIASPASAETTVAVVVQLASPQDRPVLDVVLNSFNFTPTATWPATTDTPIPTPTTTTTTSPPPTSTPPPTEMMTTVVNSSGLVSVVVPTRWENAETIGTRNDDASYRPTIVVAPDLEEFRDGFDAPGIRVFALPQVVEPAGLLANVDKPDDCDSTGPVPFDNGDFVGVSQTWTSCGGGTIDVMIVAARPADESFNLYASVQEEAGDGLLATIAGSLAIDDPDVYPPQPELPPVTPEGAVPSTLWQRPSGVDTVLVIDRLRRIGVSVPSSWQDVRNDPLMRDDGTGRPLIVASLHIETMINQIEMPGLTFMAVPYVEAEVYLANVLSGRFECAEELTQFFDDGTYRGLLHTSGHCAGSDSGARTVQVVVSPADTSTTLHLEIQVPTDNDTALQTVLSSFGEL